MTTSPGKFFGETWWHAPESVTPFEEFLLHENGFSFSLTVKSEGYTYEGTLKRSEANSPRFRGSVRFRGNGTSGQCEAWCDLLESSGLLLFIGRWNESGVEYRWHGKLERDD